MKTKYKIGDIVRIKDYKLVEGATEFGKIVGITPHDKYQTYRILAGRIVWSNNSKLESLNDIRLNKLERL
jgi:hypothetical protein